MTINIGDFLVPVVGGNLSSLLGFKNCCLILTCFVLFYCIIYFIYFHKFIFEDIKTLMVPKDKVEFTKSIARGKQLTVLPIIIDDKCYGQVGKVDILKV